MTDTELTNIATNLTKGTFHQVTYKKELALTKAHKAEGYEIYTISTYNARFGIDYDNVASVIEARENGPPKGALKGLYEVVQDLLYTNAKGELIVRCYPNWNGHHEKIYVMNGEAVSKERLLEMGFSKNELGIRDGGEPPVVMSLRASGILEIA